MNYLANWLERWNLDPSSINHQPWDGCAHLKSRRASYVNSMRLDPWIRSGYRGYRALFTDGIHISIVRIIDIHNIDLKRDIFRLLGISWDLIEHHELGTNYAYNIPHYFSKSRPKIDLYDNFPRSSISSWCNTHMVDYITWRCTCHFQSSFYQCCSFGCSTTCKGGSTREANHHVPMTINT